MRVRRGVEFLILFIAVPLLAAWQGEQARRWIIPQILAFAFVFLIVLWHDPNFDRRTLLTLPGNWPRALRDVFLVWVAGGMVFLALTAWILPAQVFALPAARPRFWLLVLALYPLLSALPQELIFRVFLFHRYRSLFASDRACIAASAIAFALAHLQLGNAVAFWISLVGGLCFAHTYARTHSWPIVAVEHGIWGDWIFTIGLGAFFYGGHY
jgi:membrane protease YdiL (CAAX protease family)